VCRKGERERDRESLDAGNKIVEVCVCRKRGREEGR